MSETDTGITSPPNELVAWSSGIGSWRPDYQGLRVSAGRGEGRVLYVDLYGGNKVAFVLTAEQARHLANLLTGTPSDAA